MYGIERDLDISVVILDSKAVNIIVMSWMRKRNEETYYNDIARGS